MLGAVRKFDHNSADYSLIIHRLLIDITDHRSVKFGLICVKPEGDINIIKVKLYFMKLIKKL